MGTANTPILTAEQNYKPSRRANLENKTLLATENRRYVMLITGGGGKFCQYLKPLLPDGHFYDRSMLDITDDAAVGRVVPNYDTIIHCAAFTSPPKVDANPELAIASNIMGTSILVKHAIKNKCRFVYISTDYVFDGEEGLYREEDPVNPVNRYAWSKLGGECAVRMMKENWVIIRCSMGPKPFPYDKAFTDQFTSRETMEEIAKKVVKVAKSNFCGVVHLGGDRKSVYDYATSVSPEKVIQPISTRDMSFKLPKDTSLDCSFFNKEFLP